MVCIHKFILHLGFFHVILDGYLISGKPIDNPDNPSKLGYKRCKSNIKTDVKSRNMISSLGSASNQQHEYLTLLFDVRVVVFHYGNIGNVSKERLYSQIDVVNEAFSGNYAKDMIDTKLRFRLQDINYVNNKNYHYRCDIIDQKLMKRYATKPDKIINIFVCESDYYLGWAYYPWSFTETNRMSSIFIHKDSIPGSTDIEDTIFESYNMGLTLVHELGHYFGLIHTFAQSGTCIDGDEISDTAVEKTPNFWCDASRDSCPNHPGKDPINNYMDYSPDECMNEFTPLQINRLWSMIDEYKPKLKHWSRDNFLRNYQESTEFINIGSGSCDSSNSDPPLILRFRRTSSTHVSFSECKTRAIKFVGQAFTYTERPFSNGKLKYNCIILKISKLDDIADIEPSSNKRFEKSHCYRLPIFNPNE